MPLLQLAILALIQGVTEFLPISSSGHLVIAAELLGNEVNDLAFDVGLHLVHSGHRLPSMPHIDMTVESLAHRGVHVERPRPGEWIVPPGALRAKDIAIEPDLSNAAPFLAAAYDFF